MRWHGAVNGWLEAEHRWDAEKDRVVFDRFHLTGGSIVRVNRRLIDGDEHPARAFVVGPHLFYPLDRDEPYDAVIAARITGPFWWLPVVRYRWQGTVKRILATAYIWGLADYPLGAEQTWRNVYALAWLERKVKELRHA